MSETVDTPATIWVDRFIRRELLPAGELARRFNILNPRSHPEAQRDATESSLDTVGWIDEISLSTNGPGPASLADNPDAVMFDGHERVELALVRGGEGALVPVKWYQLSVEETDFALLVKDPTTEMAETKPKELAALLERTRTMTVDPRLGAMLERLRVEAGINGHQKTEANPVSIDKAAELQKVWGVKVGDVWELGQHRLVCGDCTDRAVVESVMRGERPGVSFTDPPYNVGVAIGDATNDRRSMTSFVAWCKLWLEFMPEKKLLTVGVKNLLWWDEIIGSPQWVIAWVKRNGQGQTGLGGTNKWDPILVYGCLIDNQIDIIEVNNDYSEGIKAGGIHPTSKPVQLWADVLERFGEPTDIIYEPFLGTGTTLIAAEQLNRRCFGIEIEPSYCAVTLERWSQLTGQTPRRAAV